MCNQLLAPVTAADVTAHCILHISPSPKPRWNLYCYHSIINFSNGQSAQSQIRKCLLGATKLDNFFFAERILRIFSCFPNSHSLNKSFSYKKWAIFSWWPLEYFVVHFMYKTGFFLSNIRKKTKKSTSCRTKITRLMMRSA